MDFDIPKDIQNYLDELDKFIENEIKVKLIYSLSEVGWNLSKLNMVNKFFNGSIPEEVSTSY